MFLRSSKPSCFFFLSVPLPHFHKPNRVCMCARTLHCWFSLSCEQTQYFNAVFVPRHKDRSGFILDNVWCVSSAEVLELNTIPHDCILLTKFGFDLGERRLWGKRIIGHHVTVNKCGQCVGTITASLTRILSFITPPPLDPTPLLISSQSSTHYTTPSFQPGTEMAHSYTTTSNYGGLFAKKSPAFRTPQNWDVSCQDVSSASRSATSQTSRQVKVRHARLRGDEESRMTQRLAFWYFGARYRLHEEIWLWGF